MGDLGPPFNPEALPIAPPELVARRSEFAMFVMQAITSPKATLYMVMAEASAANYEANSPQGNYTWQMVVGGLAIVRNHVPALSWLRFGR